MCLVLILLYISTFQALSQETDSLNHLHELLKESRDVQSQVIILNRLGEYYLDIKPDSSFFYSKSALDKAKGQLKTESARAKRTIGRVFFTQGAYDQSLAYLFESLNEFRHSDDQYELAKTHSALGLAYQYSKSSKEALGHFKQAMSLFAQWNNPSGLAETYGHVGHYFEKKGNYDSAFYYQNQALEIYASVSDFRGKALVFGNLGSIYEDLGDFEQAHAYFWQAAKYDSLNHNMSSLVVSLNNIGDIYRKIGVYDSALYYTDQALVLAKSLDLSYQVRSAYRDLAKTYREQGELVLAYEYFDSVHALNQTLFSSQIAGQIANFQTLYNTREKEQAIALLQSQRQVERQSRNMIMTGAIALTIFAAVFIWLERRRRLNQRQFFSTQKALDDEKLKNVELQQHALETELENKRLKEEQFYSELESRSQDLTAKTLHIIQKNRLLRDIRTQIDHLEKEKKVKNNALAKLSGAIDKGFQFDREWEEFQRRFDEVHQDFLDRIRTHYPKLTATDTRLCSLIRLKLSSRDISTIMGVTPDSLRISRYRLRKKLDPPTNQKLKDFILQF